MKSFSTGISCVFTLTIKIFHGKHQLNQIKNEKCEDRSQQTMNSFDRLQKNCLKNNMVDEKDYGTLCNSFGRTKSDYSLEIKL